MEREHFTKVVEEVFDSLPESFAHAFTMLPFS
jgi:predicted Zn-dependent protease with MMP-like domain